jgi:hypothetical protein
LASAAAFSAAALISASTLAFQMHTSEVSYSKPRQLSVSNILEECTLASAAAFSAAALASVSALAY